ncbi:MAG: response regulator [Pleurocapsa minor GSE-CHR-MK-17-07R]|nr:response regulator [Pleurocapsa minor GSE-CHR-MK 17-07R]
MIWLVAEDEFDIRMLVTTMIQVWGHAPLAFENGQKIWDWVEQYESGSLTDAHPPEIVLMDIRMPGKKGNEVARRIRASETLKNTPIALMTAFALSDGERREMMDQDGVDLIISKPLPDFEVLRKMLHDLIEQKQSSAKTGASEA